MANSDPKPTLNVRGMDVYKAYLGAQDQERLLERAREIVAHAPLFSPITAFGKPMSVKMTSAGAFGWVSDRRGYRYERTHPNGTPWPPIPTQLREIWSHLVPEARDPECCLLNFYGHDARMGLHQDKDETDFSQPVVSISLGDDALFRIGGETRGGKTESIWLTSGDVVVMGGASRRLFHGIDRVKSGTSGLLSQGGRLNITLRVVT